MSPDPPVEEIALSDVLLSNFAPHFRARPIDLCQDAVLTRAIQKLRFDVYCLECRFLSAKDYPDGLESDERDQTSAHFCSHHAQGELAGYVRLAFAGADGRFPFQEHGAQVYGQTVLPPIDQAAEVSRLMVSKVFRRRRGDIVSGVNEAALDAPPDERRIASPQILLSLYRKMYHYSNAHGIRYWYAAMERSLVRSLSRFGFQFEQIGPELEYYGAVAPYMVDLRQLEVQGQKLRPELWDWLASTD